MLPWICEIREIDKVVFKIEVRLSRCLTIAVFDVNIKLISQMEENEPL